MSYIILNSEEIVFADMVSSFESHGSLVKDLAYPLTNRTSIMSDSQYRIDSLGYINKDSVIPLKYLWGIGKDWNPFVENNGFINKDSSVIYEYLLGINSDDIAGFTFRQIINSDILTPSERLTSLYKATVDEYEYLSNIQPSDIMIPIDWMGGLLITSDAVVPLNYAMYLNIDGIVNFTNLHSLIKDVTPINEYLSGVDNNGTPIIEYLQGVAGDAITHIDWTGGILVTSDGVIPLDYLMYLSQDATLRTGYLLNVPPSDGVAPLESLFSLNNDGVSRINYLEYINDDSVVQYENLVNLLQDGLSRQEYIGSINTDGILNYSSLYSINQSGLTPVVIIQTVNGDIVIPLDWTGAISVNSDAILWPEFRGILQQDGTVLTEILNSIASDRNILFEYIQKHSINLMTNLDWTGQAATLRDTPRKVFIWKDGKLVFKRGDKKRMIN